MAQSQFTFQILIEEDKAEGDFVAYIPAIRLGTYGDSLEDVRENAKDLLHMEIESRLRQGEVFLPITRPRWRKLLLQSRP
jgi:predicted RNase H-like HicB family nuclease